MRQHLSSDDILMNRRTFLIHCLLTDFHSASKTSAADSLLKIHLFKLFDLLFVCIRMQQQRADSPEPSCVSMKSDFSMDRPIKFKDGQPADGR